MKILLIHNRYGKYSGEEAVVDTQLKLLRERGHEADLFSRSSEEIPRLKLKGITAFFSGFYNHHSIRLLKKKLAEKPYDVVHIHNLYPLISPAILPFITSQSRNLANSPPKIVMTIHNYRLLCPNGLFFTHGEICHRCTGGVREFNCILRNCEKSFGKSAGYAARTWVARVRKLFVQNVDHYICLNRFQKNLLAENGYPEQRISVIPNTTGMQEDPAGKPEPGNRLGFAGRVCFEKGAHILFRAAEKLPGLTFLLAGPVDKDFIAQYPHPQNVILLGQQTMEQMAALYRNIRFLLVPSVWYEGFPMVTLEAMRYRLPVIAPRHAGFPEIIEDGVNGLLFNPGDAADLTLKITALRDDTDLCTKLGDAGHRKLATEYSQEIFYQKLMGVYNDKP
jgi:glycosyltransferase involved in cell wall biosynthesis